MIVLSLPKSDPSGMSWAVVPTLVIKFLSKSCAIFYSYKATAIAIANPAEAPATVEEMLIEGYAKVKEAACAYEKDEYQDHTLEMYMKENAALVATLAAKAMEEGYGEVKETELTQEMYEAHCNEMKEAYAKKMDELKETYGAGK